MNDHQHEWRREYAPNYRQASEANDWRETCGCGASRSGSDDSPTVLDWKRLRLADWCLRDERGRHRSRTNFYWHDLAAEYDRLTRETEPVKRRRKVKIENSETDEEAFGFEPRWSNRCQECGAPIGMLGGYEPEALRELASYATHLPGCMPDVDFCWCGLDAAVAARDKAGS